MSHRYLRTTLNTLTHIKTAELNTLIKMILSESLGRTPIIAYIVNNPVFIEYSKSLSIMESVLSKPVRLFCKYQQSEAVIITSEIIARPSVMHMIHYIKSVITRTLRSWPEYNSQSYAKSLEMLDFHRTQPYWLYSPKLTTIDFDEASKN